MKKLLSISLMCSISLLLLGQSQSNFNRFEYPKYSIYERLYTSKYSLFRFPVGNENGKGYRIAQSFSHYLPSWGYHAGIDISDLNSGDTDLGDSIFSVNNGIVIEAYDTDYISAIYLFGEKLIRIIYYHCDTIVVKTGDYITKGQFIATIGNGKGAYQAHLHLEITYNLDKSFGGYYSIEENLYQYEFIDPLKILPHWSKKRL